MTKVPLILLCLSLLLFLCGASSNIELFSMLMEIRTTFHDLDVSPQDMAGEISSKLNLNLYFSVVTAIVTLATSIAFFSITLTKKNNDNL